MTAGLKTEWAYSQMKR